jgi:transposase-like protein
MNMTNISTKEQNPVVQKKSTTNLTDLLLQCVTEPDPMLSMLAWLCDLLMEAEVSAKIGAEKSQQTSDRQNYRSGYRPRWLDTRMGTLDLIDDPESTSCRGTG